MQLALYDDTKKVIDIIPGIQDVQVNDKDVTWSGGKMLGIQVPFSVFNDDLTINIGDILTDDQIAQEVTGDLRPADLKTEDRLKRNEDAILAIMQQLAQKQ